MNCARCHTELRQPADLCGFCQAEQAEKILANPKAPQYRRALALCDLEDLGFPLDQRREIAGRA